MLTVISNITIKLDSTLSVHMRCGYVSFPFFFAIASSSLKQKGSKIFDVDKMSICMNKKYFDTHMPPHQKDFQMVPK